MDIEKLEKTLGFMRELKPEQFDYSSFVAKKKDGCGTVCCVAGWHPKWYPEGPFVWHDQPTRGKMYLETPAHIGVVSALCDFYDIGTDLVEVLFYGEAWYGHNLQGVGINAELGEVIAQWETVIGYLKTLQQ